MKQPWDGDVDVSVLARLPEMLGVSLILNVTKPPAAVRSALGPGGGEP